jgi:hypothetical protein
MLNAEDNGESDVLWQQKVTYKKKNMIWQHFNKQRQMNVCQMTECKSGFMESWQFRVRLKCDGRQ